MSAVVATVALVGALAAPPQLALPAPTGPYAVGVTDVHLMDEDRADPWVPERRRELMVSLWYPAVPGTGSPAAYVTPEVSRLILARQGVEGVPQDVLSGVRTFAQEGARPARARAGGRPLIVLSPGFTLARSSLTALAEDLASRGYAVAAIDHTYEAAAVEFPDGRVAECVACPLLEQRLVDGDTVARGRAADVAFVLDRLTGRRPAVPGVALNPQRIAMAGHSLGGAATAVAMAADPRIDAGVNLDGSFFPPVTTPLDRPFLMVGHDGHGQPGIDPGWDTTWAHLTGWRRWLTVDGTEHGSFTDYAFLGEQAGLPQQPLDGERAAEITRRYVAAFADRHLRGAPARLLAGPSARYPEVRFWDPEG